ncbi:spore germination protein [Alicyclobacillus fastidiosus]|uniref:Spore germination protein n=1 Tax=Alicyclobacillus fastidiosus TaxID=392011 RepID=A0ABY6ZNM4_9BACL|nr:spore germination protein [Alicyclobacillus fastidiosus]WAH44178.1 spore germination protein [Alicyclobacillus fastidiosus]GMA60491.1 putative membrane protein YfkQ [Alicyclobacillus fastidiosus]
MKSRKPRLLKAIKELENTSTAPSSNDVLVADLAVNEQVLRGVFESCSDVVFRSVMVPGFSKMLLVFVDGLVDAATLDKVLLKPMLSREMPDAADGAASRIIQEQLVAIAKVETVHRVKDVVDGILKSNVGVLVEGDSDALIAELKGFEKRAVEEPAAEITVRGPRDGFTETLRVNTALLRRRIRSPRLKLESLSLGDLSQTDVVIAYITGVVQETVLQEVRKRINRIEIDGVLESAYVEEFIQDRALTPFPQVQNTERPDVVCASLLEGRIAIFVDTTPFVLIVPMTFWTGLQAAEDYYERTLYTSFIRWIRFILFNVALFLPSLYVAITTYHPQLIPTNLLISIAAAREGVPFPTVIEAFMMELMFEGLREAGVRLPKAVGSAVSIVGALVIGQAAVQAGIISAPMVIVVSATGIASFAIPRYNLGIAYRILRFPVLLLAGTLGLFGVGLGALAILAHLVNLRSFGVPYLVPVAPQVPSNLKDVFLRAPLWSTPHRPRLISGADKQRLPHGKRPKIGQGNQPT